MRTYVACIALTLTACGGSDDDSPTAAPAPAAPYSIALATVEELPACDADHDKQLVYILATKEFQTCQAGAWAKVEIAVPAAPVDPAEVNLAKNLMATIKVDDTLDTMLPEARELVLSGTKGTAAGTSGTGTEYTISRYDGATQLYYYVVRFNSDGKVASVYDGSVAQ